MKHAPGQCKGLLVQGQLVTFLGQAFDLPGHNRHGPHDQLVFGQFAGRYFSLPHDIGAVLADGREDDAYYPILESLLGAYCFA